MWRNGVRADMHEADAGLRSLAPQSRTMSSPCSDLVSSWLGAVMTHAAGRSDAVLVGALLGSSAAAAKLSLLGPAEATATGSHAGRLQASIWQLQWAWARALGTPGSTSSPRTSPAARRCPPPPKLSSATYTCHATPVQTPLQSAPYSIPVSIRCTSGPALKRST